MGGVFYAALWRGHLRAIVNSACRGPNDEPGSMITFCVRDPLSLCVCVCLLRFFPNSKTTRQKNTVIFGVRSRNSCAHRCGQTPQTTNGDRTVAHRLRIMLIWLATFLPTGSKQVSHQEGREEKVRER